MATPAAQEGSRVSDNLDEAGGGNWLTVMRNDGSTELEQLNVTFTLWHPLFSIVISGIYYWIMTRILETKIDLWEKK